MAFFPEYFRLTVGFDGPIVLHVEGELDMGSAPLFGDALTALAESGETSVLVDADRLGFMDSSGLHHLIRAKAQFEAAGGELRVINQSDQVIRLFAVSGLTEQFPDGSTTAKPADTSGDPTSRRICA
jgi:anti-sigma B factor antagonist